MNILFLPLCVLLFFTDLRGTYAATAPPVLKLWRMDCGKIHTDDLNEFSDTYAYTGQSKNFVASCYLIQHGENYLLWDLGLPKADRGLPLQGPGSNGETFSVTIAEQLQTLGVTPQQVSVIAISHYHFDHTGQAEDFTHARLLLGHADVEQLRRANNPRAKPLMHWLSGEGELEEVAGDRDVFGDRSVIMIDLPGHTPGHHGLLVKLPHAGYVLLSGDAAHFRQNYETNGLPSWNTDRAQTLASLDRIRQIVRNLHALLILQHDEADIGKLPIFPRALD
jgi:N-acyl homoserine lactone hydrolase